MTALTEQEIRDRLLGAWQLVTWRSGDGHPLGENAVGQLLYTEQGRVSAQLARADQPRFASDDWQLATAEEMCAAWPSYFGYFGTYTIDTSVAAVTHHVEGGWFPNLAGTRQVRHYRFDGDHLVLDADTTWGQVQIIWKRL